MVFQRHIYQSHQAANWQAMKRYQDEATLVNAYSAHRFAPQSSQSLPKNLHLSAAGKSVKDAELAMTSPTTGLYYNHTLKRYVRSQNAVGGDPMPPLVPPTPPERATSDTHVTAAGTAPIMFRKPIVRRVSRSASFSSEALKPFLVRGKTGAVPPSPAESTRSTDKPKPTFFLDESNV